MRAFIWYSILDRCIEYLADNVRINCSVVEIPDLYVGKRFSIIRFHATFPWDKQQYETYCRNATLKKINQIRIYVEGEPTNEWIDISDIINWVDSS